MGNDSAGHEPVAEERKSVFGKERKARQRKGMKAKIGNGEGKESDGNVCRKL